MERWGLEQKNLPPGSTVLFREPSLWEQHRYLISGSAAVVAAQSLVLAGLLFQRRRRQQAEQSLKESEDRMTFAAASASIGLWQFNLATGQLWSTEHCQVIFGLPAGVPLTRQTFLGAIHPDDRSIAAAALQGALKGGRSAIADIRVVSTPDEVRWVRIRARSDVYGQNTAGQLSGMFADVTDQKAPDARDSVGRTIRRDCS
jgi:PAS domain-containing protein